MKRNYLLVVILLLAVAMSSCSTMTRMTTNTVPRINLDLNDLELSEPKTAEVTNHYVLYVDWAHLLKTRIGSAQAMVYAMEPMNIIPTPTNKTMNHAVHELLKDNPGYEMVVYPQFETEMKRPVIGIGFIYQRVNVKVTARLAKIKK